MRRAVSLWVSVMVFSVVGPGWSGANPPSTESPEALEWLARGDALYLERHDPKNWALAMAAYRKALQAAPDNYEVLWRLARIHGFVAEREQESDRIRKLGDQGYQYAQQATQLRPDRVEGHYYAGFALGQYAKTLPVFQALYEGMDGKCTGLMETAMKIDPSFDNGGPLLAMGRYYHSCPWPKYDPEKALALFRRALRKHPTARANVFVAETLRREEQYAEALRACDDALKIQPEPNTVSYADDLWYQQKARQLKRAIRAEME